MSVRRSAVLLASVLAAPGEREVRAAGAASACGLQVGAGIPLNPKEWPCEDSVALHVLGTDGRLAAVADAHWGGRSGEFAVEELRDAFERVRGAREGEERMRATVRAIDHAWGTHPESEEDGSETTLLAAHVAGRRLAWASFGDSLVLAVGEDGTRLLNRPRPVFLGRLGAFPADALDSGERELETGEIALLATDGLEQRASGLTQGDVARLLLEGAGSRSLEERVRLLLERADDPRRGAGRDNLGVVALAVG